LSYGAILLVIRLSPQRGYAHNGGNYTGFPVYGKLWKGAKTRPRVYDFAATCTLV